MVVVGAARFTVLSDRLVRIEYLGSAAGFEDRPTHAVRRREVSSPPPRFTTKLMGKRRIIETARFQLAYAVGQPFSASSLQIRPSPALAAGSPSSSFTPWKFGDVDLRNLGAPTGTDGIGSGLLSRSGWAVLDDSTSRTINILTDWLDTSNTNAVDCYVFLHGHSYADALRDFRLISGAAPLPPRFALGAMWDRSYDADPEAIIASHAARNLPLDAVILGRVDHKRWADPAATLGRLAAAGLGVALAAGEADCSLIHPEVPHWAAAAKRLLGANAPVLLHPTTLDALKTGDGGGYCVNRLFAEAVDDVLLRPLEDDGVDGWWSKAGGGCASELVDNSGCVSIDAAAWRTRHRYTAPRRRRINAARNNPHELVASGSRAEKRGFAVGAYGGLGSHRYPLGFASGSYLSTWASLLALIKGTNRAANVGYGAWAHELKVASMRDKEELRTRWLQWSAFSPLLRTSPRDSVAAAPSAFAAANRDALRQREELLPYIYTAYRVYLDTGLPLVRPCYFEWPTAEGAYGGGLPAAQDNQEGRTATPTPSQVVTPASGASPSDGVALLLPVETAVTSATQSPILQLAALAGNAALLAEVEAAHIAGVPLPSSRQEHVRNSAIAELSKRKRGDLAALQTLSNDAIVRQHGPRARSHLEHRPALRRGSAGGKPLLVSKMPLAAAGTALGVAPLHQSIGAISAKTAPRISALEQLRAKYGMRRRLTDAKDVATQVLFSKWESILRHSTVAAGAGKATTPSRQGGPAALHAQYMFGPDLLVSAIVRPTAAQEDSLARVDVWFPPGHWIERHGGATFAGGARTGTWHRDLRYELSEFPVFCRANAIIPSLPLFDGSPASARRGDSGGSTVGVARRQYDHIVWTVHTYHWPLLVGGADRSFSANGSVYEDDGTTTAYLAASKDGAAWTTGKYSYSEAKKQLRFTLSTNGTYEELSRRRKITLRLRNSVPAAYVRLGDDPNNKLPFCEDGWSPPHKNLVRGFPKGCFSYSTATATLTVTLPEVLTSSGVELVVHFAGFADTLPMMTGVRGAMRHVDLAADALKARGAATLAEAVAFSAHADVRAI
tara:strand:+ start:473 stop:3682 length:3210 start_codon:yes stop_codon:yes gene_type:complete